MIGSKQKVKVIFKKGSRTEPGNYRPVSLTCIVCKVLESIIRDAVVAHMNSCKLYTDCQHGFRQKRSCISQLLEVIDYVTKAVDQGKPVDVVYLDFKKAFDSVPHKRLLTQLSAYGVGGHLLKWIKRQIECRR
eukprot:TRINITY_DN45753_c0_g1_i14.p1 TRINITY_DN45753_c0_g1~~TRINITY_DN45753_c0_g1_i14.p1  ORF type:complete len:133 (+),score=19.72 TRINITY_DN45753_c0_g1_i14:306-704(+)